MRTFFLALVVISLCVVARAAPPGEAEAATERFAGALARFDVIPMVEEMHSDVHKFCQTMVIHIAETTEPKTEQEGLLKVLGVARLEDLKKLTPKAATVRFFQFGFSTAPKAAKDASLRSKITIVGSLVENDVVHVLYRTETDLTTLSLSVNVPSVVTLKREGGSWKVASTTQLESMKAKLRTQADGK